jgi:hypothetical protein
MIEPLLGFVHLSSEPTVEPVRQDGSFRPRSRSLTLRSCSSSQVGVCRTSSDSPLVVQ